MTVARKTILVNASPSAFFDVITDYERYPQILPEIETAHIQSRQKNRVEARFTINLIKRVGYTLALVETRPTDLTWTLVEGPFTKNAGAWQLEERPDGTTQAHYTVDLRVGLFVPKALSNRIVGKTLPSMLAHFKAWAERKAASR